MCRVEPSHKSMLVEVLKRQNEVVSTFQHIELRTIVCQCNRLLVYHSCELQRFTASWKLSAIFLSYIWDYVSEHYRWQWLGMVLMMHLHWRRLTLELLWVLEQLLPRYNLLFQLIYLRSYFQTVEWIWSCGLDLLEYLIFFTLFFLVLGFIGLTFT